MIGDEFYRVKYNKLIAQASIIGDYAKKAKMDTIASVNVTRLSANGCGLYLFKSMLRQITLFLDL